MRHFLNPAINTIFLILGTACNLHCRYCLQQFAPTEADDRGRCPDDSQNGCGKSRPEAGPARILPFIRDVARNQETPLTIQFYGGEPLLYFDTMRQIVDALESETTIAFSTITNGTLVTREIVEFFNAHDFSVAVSWDGTATETTRGVDVFRDKEDLLLDIKKLGISSVLSGYTYPFDIFERYIPLDQKYHERHGHSLILNVDEIMDTGLADKGLTAIDHDRLRGEMTAIADEYLKYLNNEEHNPYYRFFAQQYIWRIKNGVSRKCGFDRAYAACGNGISVLNLDMNGNLYKCHNNDSVLGTIEDSYYSILQASLLRDPTARRAAACAECPVVALCQCGCPMISDAVREESYCAIKQSAFLPFVELLLRIGEHA